jgi:hypothetical protein
MAAEGGWQKRAKVRKEKEHWQKDGRQKNFHFDLP